ncbi:hypothetical protein Droror1_Dr00011484 [Drosera rotundifolia]
MAMVTVSGGGVDRRRLRSIGKRRGGKTAAVGKIVVMDELRVLHMCRASFMAPAKQYQGCVMRRSQLGTKLNRGGVKAFFINPIDEAARCGRSSNCGGR